MATTVVRDKLLKGDIGNVLNAIPGIKYEDTTSPKGEAGGKVTVGNESKEWVWCSMTGEGEKVDVPSRLGLLSWLALKSPKFAESKYAPKGKPSPKPQDTPPSPVDPPKVTALAFWKDYSLDQLEAVQSLLTDEIPKRREAEKSKDVAEAVRLLARHGVHSPKDFAALLKTDGKSQE